MTWINTALFGWLGQQKKIRFLFTDQLTSYIQQKIIINAVQCHFCSLWFVYSSSFYSSKRKWTKARLWWYSHVIIWIRFSNIFVVVVHTFWLFAFFFFHFLFARKKLFFFFHLNNRIIRDTRIKWKSTNQTNKQTWYSIINVFIIAIIIIIIWCVLYTLEWPLNKKMMMMMKLIL